MSTRTFKSALAVVATAAAAVTAVAFTAPAQAVSRPLNYVAMGDSYSAGSGVVPLDPNAPLECIRSSANYPHDLAAKLGAQLTDVTCGGATTADFATAQYSGVAPQLDALNASTDLVTVTIGGNDSNVFINAILDCVTAGASTLGFGSPCQDKYGSSFDQTLDTTTYASVKTALQAVQAKAPNARVAIVGYPWIVPTQWNIGCLGKMPIAGGDIPYLRDLQAHLNAAVQRAANETGVTYVDLSAASRFPIARAS